MRAAEIAAQLGDARRNGRGWRCRCPIRVSLVITDGRDGRILVRCWGSGCDPRDILTELRRRGLLLGAVDHRPAPIPTRPFTRDDTARRIAVAQRIWDAAHDTRRSPVAAYLAGRGITIDPPPSLRWAPALRRRDGTDGPAMIGRIDSIDGKLIGIARTWLTRDAAGSWHRHHRAMLGRAAGGAVRLAPAAETLMIGEGIETCLSAAQATGMPAWAALSTSGLRALVLPPIVREIVILADNDANGAGAAAACDAARRWLSAGRAVRLAMPPDLGDFNDMLIAGMEPRHVAA